VVSLFLFLLPLTTCLATAWAILVAVFFIYLVAVCLATVNKRAATRGKKNALPATPWLNPSSSNPKYSSYSRFNPLPPFSDNVEGDWSSATIKSITVAKTIKKFSESSFIADELDSSETVFEQNSLVFSSQLSLSSFSSRFRSKSFIAANLS
jgi:hypothetical protein